MIHGNGLTLEDNVSVGPQRRGALRPGRSRLPAGEQLHHIEQGDAGGELPGSRQLGGIGGGADSANSFVTGAPAQVKRPVTEKQLSAMRTPLRNW